MNSDSCECLSFLQAQSAGFKEYQLQVMANAKSMANALLSRGYDLVSGE